MKYDILQIFAMVIMGVAAATGIRLILDPAAPAWLTWLPNFGARLAVTALLLALALALTTWAYRKAAAQGRRPS